MQLLKARNDFPTPPALVSMPIGLARSPGKTQGRVIGRSPATEAKWIRRVSLKLIELESMGMTVREDRRNPPACKGGGARGSDGKKEQKNPLSG